MAETGKLLLGLDIGTTKIAAVICEVTELGKVNIVGVGVHPARGLKRGAVVNLEETVQSITGAIKSAELMAGATVDEALVGIAGEHITSMDSKGVIGISTPTREITYEDVNRVIEAASAIALPADRRIVDIIPQKFEIDDQKGVDNPIGLTGTRLEATVHLVTCAESFAENIIRSVEKTGYNVSRLILEPLASSEAVLTKDEKELGVAVLDIGGGTADSVVFLDRCIVKTFVVPLGGNDLTRDLAIGLRTPMHNAEDLKVRFGSVWLPMVDEDESVEVPGVGGRAAKAVAQTTLVEILGARMEEIFLMAKQEIHRLGIYDMLAAGVVLTGGSAKIPGTVELAEEVFELPTRLGGPANIGGLGDVIGDPSFATGVGLVLYDLMRERPKARRKYRARGIIRWFKELFRDFS